MTPTLSVCPRSKQKPYYRMNKTKPQLHQAYIKSNKQRRQRIVSLSGFSDETSYLNSLKGVPVSTPLVNTTTGHVCNILVLDASSSMRGDKEMAAREGCYKIVQDIKAQDNGQVQQSLVVIMFGSRAKTIAKQEGVGNINDRFVDIYSPNGMTALNDGILLATEEANTIGAEETIITILTDGEENHSRCPLYKIREKVAAAKNKGYGFVALGSGYRFNSYFNNIGIEAANQMKVENTGEGFMDTMSTYTKMSKAVYASATRGVTTDKTNLLSLSKTIIQ